MDVRCERCQTEYELEDSTVPDGGCAVQCTQCDFTFTVKPLARDIGQPQAQGEDFTPPPAADWLLETSDGKLHRFRNLTSLQKWIIERKVTRDDKISRTGHAWRRLGEIVELGPFFDVVDEADRGRAAHAVVPSEDEQKRRTSARSIPKPAVSDDELAAFDNESSRQMGKLESEGQTAVVSLNRGGAGAKIGVVVLIAAAVGVAGIYVWQQQKDAFTVSPNGGGPRPVEPNGVGKDPVVVEPPAPPPVSDPAPVAVPPPAPPVAVPPVAVPTPVVPTPVANGTGGKGAATPPVPAPPEPVRTYDELLTQADRLLENGATDRAQRLYEQALKQQPNGVEVLTGMGYVMLDKSRNGPARSYFRKALAGSSSFGPALFGLGEASRADGDVVGAIAAYRRYLEANPSGPYVVAAKRQLEMLADQAPGSP